MRQYGFNKTTEFTKKQIGVIYALGKKQELKVENWIIKDLYNLADYYGYDDNRNVERAEREVLNILKSVFDHDLEKAQELINLYTESKFESLGRKSKEKINRNILA